MDSPIEEIKSRLDIVEFVGQYLKLKKNGANLSALCPFHSEKSGSFFVSPTRQTWKCFGCGKGGDIFTFVQEIEGVEFGDALRILAAKAGVELKRQTRESVQMKTERQRLYEACELAARFFEKQLASSKTGAAAKKYLLDRGFSEKSIAAWRLGWAPSSWQGLHDFLASQGYTDKEIVGAGLAAASAGGRVYDRFRGRIMFPISDFNSQVVGFGGRMFEDAPDGDRGSAPTAAAAEPKYLNTARTALYDKGRLLYGLDRAKVAIRQADACVLVEGYADAIMSAQAGVENVVATSGTALTEDHLKIIKRFTNNLILGYDLDLAGENASRRGIDMARAAGFDVRVARPAIAGKDPADIVAADSREWQKATAGAKSIMEFYFDRAFAAGDKNSPAGRKKIADFILPAIKIIPNAIEQAFWLQKIADKIEARDIHYEEYLRQELKKVRINQNGPAAAAVSRAPFAANAKSRETRLEERILTLAVKFPAHIGLVGDAPDFFTAEGKEIAARLRAGGFPKGEIAGKTGEYYETLFFAAENETVSEAAAAEEIEFHVAAIRENIFKNSLAHCARDLIRAETAGDLETAGNLREKYNKLCKKTKNSVN